MKEKRNLLFIVMAVCLIGLGLPGVSLAANVFTECAYTDTTFMCEIYVNTDGADLRSGGVLMTYDTSKLSDPAASKNEAVWFFGDGSSQYAYMNPDTSTTGQIVFIVGKLNTADTAAGVGGTRVKIGEVSFTRVAPVENPVPGTQGPAQAAFFGITTDLGRDAPYVNFVSTAGAELDSAPIGFSEKVAERGDANADGSIDAGDFRAIALYFPDPAPPIYSDCNGDGTVDAGDFRCAALKF